MPSAVRALLILAGFYVLFEYGAAPLTGVVTGIPAPLPASLTRMYTGVIALAILLYYSVREETWRDFLHPVLDYLRTPSAASPARRGSRVAILLLVPLLAGWQGYQRMAVRPEPPADPPGIHFSLPSQYISIRNPLPWTAENIREGGILYTRNCAMCHGDSQDGNGLFARAWQPKPANFRDTGTIAQLDENYLYWRIKEGGPGLPKGSIEYRSAMPVWDGVLTDEQIWKIILFEYTNAGVVPAKRE